MIGSVALCRVVYVVNEPGRRGFAYGTLPGHPASRLARIGGPLTRLVRAVRPRAPSTER